jgi:hypothetical protein
VCACVRVHHTKQQTLLSHCQPIHNHGRCSRYCKTILVPAYLEYYNRSVLPRPGVRYIDAERSGMESSEDFDRVVGAVYDVITSRVPVVHVVASQARRGHSAAAPPRCVDVSDPVPPPSVDLGAMYSLAKRGDWADVMAMLSTASDEDRGWAVRFVPMTTSRLSCVW